MLEVWWQNIGIPWQWQCARQKNALDLVSRAELHVRVTTDHGLYKAC